MTPEQARRRRAQAGTTLIELLVATVIIGFALVLLVGMFSTGAIDSHLANRNTSVEAATSYELEKISSMPFSASPTAYSECFTSTVSANPTVIGYGGSCSGTSSFRADVSPSQPQGRPQTWTIQITVWPGAAPVGTPVSVYKVNR